jgi:hypothetical protein
MKWINCLKRAFQAVNDWLAPALRVIEHEGESMPASIPTNRVIHLLDESESWSLGMTCPCGCEDVLELMLLPDIKPRWNLTIDSRGRPTLRPSVWRTTGCRSHFWVRDGRIHWCR